MRFGTKQEGREITKNIGSFLILYMHFTEFKIFLTRGAVGHSEEVSP